MMQMGRNNTVEDKFHPLAVTAFLISILGIVLVGLITGAVAAILAGVAIGRVNKSANYRGNSLAVAAIIIGLCDIVLWVLLLGMLITADDLQAGRVMEQTVFPATSTLERTPQHIRQALEANVFVLVNRKRWPHFLRSETLSGSGIVISGSGMNCLVLTNRHVIDPLFSFDTKSPKRENAEITVYFYDGSSSPGRVLWTEPNGIDLALVATGSNSYKSVMPEVKYDKQVEIGDKVFAVGNPHELSWSYTEGVISGIRETVKGKVKIKLLQTQTPINQGNSGGGLYTADGTLIGIVTWTKDKSLSEGISFAIPYEAFLTLYVNSNSDEKTSAD